MRTLRHVPLLLLAIALSSTPAAGQLSLEMRVSTVQAEDYLPRDVGFSGDAVWELTEVMSIFAGYNWAEFTFRDGDRAHYRSSGVQAGARATLLPGSRVRPWIGLGVVRNALRYQVPGQSFDEESDATFGTLVAAGFDVPLLDAVTLSPSVHHRRFSAEINEPECDNLFSMGPPSFCGDFTSWGFDLAVRVRVLD